MLLLGRLLDGQSRDHGDRQLSWVWLDMRGHDLPSAANAAAVFVFMILGLATKTKMKV
jgi:hypothetical protein